MYLNYGDNDHRSYVKLKPKKIQAWTGFEPMTSVIPMLYQLSFQTTL